MENLEHEKRIRSNKALLANCYEGERELLISSKKSRWTSKRESAGRMNGKTRFE